MATELMKEPVVEVLKKVCTFESEMGAYDCHEFCENSWSSG